MNKTTIALLVLLSTALSLHGFAKSTKKDKPNIIILFADDISARELPIYGSSVWSCPPQGGNSNDQKYRAKTPVLDKMATDGVWIKTAWAATLCNPSRAMMMTGRYAHKHKWWHNKDKGTWVNEQGKKESYPLYESSPHTLAHVAKAGGYSTLWAGKTQMSGVDQFGFDEGVFTPGVHDKENKNTDFKIVQKKIDKKRVLINEDTGDQVKYYQQFGWYWQPHVELMNHPDSKTKFEIWPNTAKSKKEYGLHTYGPDVELDFVFDFIERKYKKDEPFFVYHTSHLGHDGWDFFSPDINPKTRQKWPGTPKIEWKNGKYKRTTPVVTGDKGHYDTHGTVTEGGIHTHINYLDFQVWQYMNKLKELGIEDNTIFIFCADNGTSGYGKASPAVQKGVHVPMIIYAPCLNMTKQGEQDILVNLADVLPTVAEIGQVKMPEDYEINGVSLLPYLTTKTTEHRDWIYGYNKHQQLIRGDKVLIDGFGKEYNVTDDPNDLISFPKVTEKTKVSKEWKEQKELLNTVLPLFDLHETEHDAPKKAPNVEPLVGL